MVDFCRLSPSIRPAIPFCESGSNGRNFNSQAIASKSYVGDRFPTRQAKKKEKRPANQAQQNPHQISIDLAYNIFPKTQVISHKNAHNFRYQFWAQFLMLFHLA